MIAFGKLQWYEMLGFNVPLLLVCLLIFLSMLPVALVRFIRDRRLGADRNPEPRDAHGAYRLIVVISVLNLLFVVGNMLWGEQIVFGIPLIYKVVL